MTPTERALRDRIDLLEEENRQLRETVRFEGAIFPADWELTGAHARMLAALAKAPAGFLSREAVHAVCSRNGETLVKVIDTQMSRLREKVKGKGIQIVTRWGVGFEMPEASRAIVKAALKLRKEGEAR